jgi:hypothetical protein
MYPEKVAGLIITGVQDCMKVGDPKEETTNT